MHSINTHGISQKLVSVMTRGATSPSCLRFPAVLSCLLLCLFFSPAAVISADIVAVEYLMGTGPGWKDTRPSDVLVVVLGIEGGLRNLLKADQVDFNEAVIGRGIMWDERSPRHVLQKARELFLKVENLREINGLPKLAFPEVEAGKTNPADVRAAVMEIQKSLAPLLTLYGAEYEKQAFKVDDDTVPSDVYRALSRCSRLIDLTEIPEIVPNDVYRIVLSIESEIERITGSISKQPTLVEPVDFSGKKPEDVYDLATELHGVLARLTSELQLDVPGGLVPAAHSAEEVTSSEVADLLNNILADMIAVRVELGLSGTVYYAPPQSGMTPTKIFGKLDHMLQVLRHAADQVAQK